MPIIDKNGIVANAQSDIALIANNLKPEEIYAQNHNAEILGIEFPNHSDGRGFSIAKRLRRLGFNGRLRAIGPLIPDQFSDLIACGFDEVEISQTQLERQPIEQWLEALKIIDVAYQNGNAAKTSIIAKRWGK